MFIVRSSVAVSSLFTAVSCRCWCGRYVSFVRCVEQKTSIPHTHTHISQVIDRHCTKYCSFPSLSPALTTNLLPLLSHARDLGSYPHSPHSPPLTHRPLLFKGNRSLTFVRNLKKQQAVRAAVESTGRWGVRPRYSATCYVHAHVLNHLVDLVTY